MRTVLSVLAVFAALLLRAGPASATTVTCPAASGVGFPTYFTSSDSQSWTWDLSNLPKGLSPTQITAVSTTYQWTDDATSGTQTYTVTDFVGFDPVSAVITNDFPHNIRGVTLNMTSTDLYTDNLAAFLVHGAGDNDWPEPWSSQISGAPGHWQPVHIVITYS